MIPEIEKGRILLFIKFSEKEKYLTDIQQGNLYMNNGKYFINREKQDGVQGIGDKDELTATLSDVKIKFYDGETKIFLLEGEAQGLSFYYDYVLTTPIFCMTYIDSESLNMTKVNKDSVDCQIDFSGESIDKIIEDFGEYALVIPPQEFEERLRESLKEQNIDYISNKVTYEDYSINSARRMHDYHNHKPSLFFKKDHSFEYQKEYRIVLKNIDSKEPYILNIGDISDISRIVPTRELLSDAFSFNLSK